MPDVMQITMTVLEAKECVEKINKNMANIRQLILELYEREGWAALGYDTWRSCVVAEFKQSQSYLYYQLEAAKTERNISTIVENTNTIPESQLRPLTSIKDPEEQREIYQRAIETAPAGKVTAKHIENTVKSLKIEKNKPFDKQKELISPEFLQAYEVMLSAIKREIARQWKETSRGDALKRVQILQDIIKLGGQE